MVETSFFKVPPQWYTGHKSLCGDVRVLSCVGTFDLSYGAFWLLMPTRQHSWSLLSSSPLLPHLKKLLEKLFISLLHLNNFPLFSPYLSEMVHERLVKNNLFSSKQAFFLKWEQNNPHRKKKKKTSYSETKDKSRRIWKLIF